MTFTGGLYVHLPFCNVVCPYCDFAVVAGRRSSHQAYLSALLAEARAHEGFVATSVFVGGGTPSFVDADALGTTLRTLPVSVPADAEVTIECNPETTTADGLRALPMVNRVSIGAQSFDPEVLRALGRTHEAEATGAAVRAAREAGIANVSLDLIYGTPVETDDAWARTLRTALDLEPQHVSCYALTVEEGTPFARTGVAPDEDALASRFEIAGEILGEAGFEHYEVSNWAVPGARSQHNLTYWTQGDYLGLGPGAHSHRAGHRWWNTRSLDAYLRDPAAARAGEEVLTEAERAEEWVMLRLRLTDGVPLEEAARRLGHPLPVGEVLAAGLATVVDGHLRLSSRGLLLGNRVAAMLAA